MDSVKSNAKSNSLRADGNEFYKQRNFFDALLKYNESLCYAEIGSESAGHAFANRSAIFLEMKLFDECLTNIQEAFRHNYPEKNYEVLKKREEKCQKMMKNLNKKSEDILEFFKLSHEPNKKVSSIADCLEMKTSKKYGRYIVTNKALKVGDVIVNDEPYCRVLKNQFLLQRCTNCFKTNLLNLIPCEGCTKVMFCSIECRDEAAKNYHLYECPIMDLITSLTDNFQMALRTFFKALSTFDNSIEFFHNFMNDFQPTTIFGSSSSDEILKLSAICSLIGNDEISINDEIVSYLFAEDEGLAKIWKTHGDFVKKILNTQISIANKNSHEVSGWQIKKIKQEENNSMAYQKSTEPYGTAVYPLASLFNHSCAPNIHKIFIDGKLILIVQRSIEAGSQIFDNYGYSFTNIDKKYRQLQLSEQFQFQCDCEACEKNFPILSSLKIIDRICLKFAKKISQELSSLNQKRAKFKINEISELIQKYNGNFPSLEICSLIESFQACVEIYQKPHVNFSSKF